MSDVRNSRVASNELDSTISLAAFPQMPGEDFLAHAGVQYWEQVNARLADMGLLAVAKEGADPDSVKELIDFDLSLVPALPPTHPHYHRNLETRMRYQQHNDANHQKRLALRYKA